MMLQKILSSKMPVRFSDCDPFNHLNNAKYIDYFLNAREDQLWEYYNFSVFRHSKESGCGWVVVQHEIAYLKPAITMETVLIESQLLRFGEKDILVEFRMFDESRTTLKSLMWTKFFYYNLVTQRSEIHTPDLIDRFQPLEADFEIPASFDIRVSAFRNEK